ncbi:hypothetical protein ACFSO7_21210 [Bacillus sp. CGMCC 1.16607]|uniref:hypothetical protein n=1 Tax=Bacillus sp. CGMCC 1.16607 TaxID=3351842 RepID=UPI00363902AC
MLKKSMILGVALALGLTTASYTASSQTNPKTVEVKKEVKKTSMEEQLEMLEKAIVPTNPDDTIATWAKAVKNRNGALQYAMFTQNVKNGIKKSFEQFHWVSGASSPWVDQYTVISKKENKDKTLQYVVEFELATSFGIGKDQAIVTLVKQGEQWFIKSLAPASEKSVGIWNTPESINESSFTKNMVEINSYDSKLGYQIKIPKKVTTKLSFKESTCENEEGKPSCTKIFYKDGKNEVSLISIIRLTKEQEKSSYYLIHPFIKKVGETKDFGFYYTFPSEHPYGEKENTTQGKEWTSLLGTLKERVQKIIVK